MTKNKWYVAQCIPKDEQHLVAKVFNNWEDTRNYIFSQKRGNCLSFSAKEEAEDIADKLNNGKISNIFEENSLANNLKRFTTDRKIVDIIYDYAKYFYSLDNDEQELWEKAFYDCLKGEADENYGYDKLQLDSLYMARYAYVYSFEYKEIYSHILDLLDKTSPKVLTIGTGQGLDYFGLVKAMKQNIIDLPICYTGADINEWACHVTPRAQDQDSFKFLIGNEYTKTLNDNKGKESYNVLFFPKMLEEISRIKSSAFIDNIISSITMDNTVYAGITTIDTDNKYSQIKANNIAHHIKHLIDKMSSLGYTVSALPINEDNNDLINIDSNNSLSDFRCKLTGHESAQNRYKRYGKNRNIAYVVTMRHKEMPDIFYENNIDYEWLAFDDNHFEQKNKSDNIFSKMFNGGTEKWERKAMNKLSNSYFYLFRFEK